MTRLATATVALLMIVASAATTTAVILWPDSVAQAAREL
jgi:hypothetical protein